MNSSVANGPGYMPSGVEHISRHDRPACILHRRAVVHLSYKTSRRIPRNVYILIDNKINIILSFRRTKLTNNASACICVALQLKELRSRLKDLVLFVILFLSKWHGKRRDGEPRVFMILYEWMEFPRR